MRAHAPVLADVRVCMQVCVYVRAFLYVRVFARLHVCARVREILSKTIAVVAWLVNYRVEGIGGLSRNPGHPPDI